HDGEKTGVLRQADELLSVEEFVLLNHDAFRFPRGVRSVLGQVDSAAKNREQQAEHKDHYDQTAFLKAKSWTRRRPVGGGGWTHLTVRDASKRRSIRQGECLESVTRRRTLRPDRGCGRRTSRSTRGCPKAA